MSTFIIILGLISLGITVIRMIIPIFLGHPIAERDRTAFYIIQSIEVIIVIYTLILLTSNYFKN